MPRRADSAVVARRPVASGPSGRGFNTFQLRKRVGIDTRIREFHISPLHSTYAFVFTSPMSFRSSSTLQHFPPVFTVSMRSTKPFSVTELPSVAMPFDTSAASCFAAFVARRAIDLRVPRHGGRAPRPCEGADDAATSRLRCRGATTCGVRPVGPRVQHFSVTEACRD